METTQIPPESVETPISPVKEVTPKKIKIKKPRKKHYWWRFILVFLTGMVTTVVAEAVGIVYATIAIKMSNIETWTGQEGNLFTEEYRDLSVFQVVMRFLSGDVKVDSLEGISKITPFVDNTIIDYLEQIGLTRDDYEMITKFQFSEFGSQEFINTLVSNIKLSAIFTPERLGSEGLANAFSLYPSDAPDAVNGYKEFTIQNILNNELYQDDIKFDSGKDKGSYNNEYIKYVIDNIVIDAIMPINDGDMLAFLKGAKIGEIESTFRNTTFCAIVGEENCTGILTSFSDTKLGDLLDDPSSVLNKIELKDAISIDGLDGPTRAILDTLLYEPDSGLPTTIGWLQDGNNMQSVVNSIKLKDVLSLDDVSGTTKNLLETLFYQPGTSIPTTIGWLQGSTNGVSNMQTIMEDIKIKDVIDTSNMDESTKGIIETLFNQPNTSTPITIGWLGGKTGEVANAKTVLDSIKLVDAFGINRDEIEDQITRANHGMAGAGEKYTQIQITLCYENYIDTDPEAIADTSLIGKPNPNKPRTIAGLQGDKLDSTVKGFKVKDIIEVGDDNPLLDAIKDTTIDKLEDKINTLTLRDVVPSKYLDVTSDDYNKVIAALASKKDEHDEYFAFTDISKAVDQLTINDYLELNSSSHPIMRWLVNEQGETPLNNIGTIINDIPLNKIVEDKILYRWVSTDEPIRYRNDLLQPEGFKDNADYNKPLASILNKTNPDTGKAYKLSEITESVNEITIGEVINTNGDKVLEALADVKITAESSEFRSALNTVRIGDVLDTSDSKILEAIENLTIGADSSDFTSAINNLTFGDVVDTSGSDILDPLKNVKIGDPSSAYIDAVKGISIRSFIKETAEEKSYCKWRRKVDEESYTYSDDQTMPEGYEENPDCSQVLFAIYTEGGSIGNLSTTLSTLTVGQVIKEANDPDSMLHPLKDVVVTSLTGSVMMEKLNVETVFGSEIYGSEVPHEVQNIQGVWKYLLREEREPEFTEANNGYSYKFRDYTLADMSQMMDNFNYNMKHAKIRELAADQLIEIEPATLEKVLIGNTTKKIGDYTFTELLNAISTYLR